MVRWISVLLLALAACGKPRSKSSPELPRMIEMRKAMCACHDTPCVNQVTEANRDLKAALDKYTGEKPHDLAVEYQEIMKCLANAVAPR